MEQITNEATVQAPGGSRLTKRTRTLLITGVLLVILAAAYLALCGYAHSLNTFYPNYRMNGIPVGGLTVDAAQSALEQGLSAQEIVLLDAATGEQVASLPLFDLGYTAADFQGDAQFWMDDLKDDGFWADGWNYLAFLTGRYPGGWHWPDPDAARFKDTVAALTQSLSLDPLDSAYDTAENALLLTRAKDGRTISVSALSAALQDPSAYSHAAYQVPLTFTVLPAKTLTAQEIYNTVAGEMKNAGYDAEADAITPERVGAEFDVAAAQAALDAAAPGETVSVPAEIQQPHVTAQELEAVLFRDVLGECRTHVSGTAARISNVRLAASAFDGTVLNCGDIFSYNEATGQRTEDKGYQPAPAYVRGETVDEIGGGVCQPSSTLYLACLLANLEITERYAHRYVPAYITRGMDATVSWGGPDYKFTNNTDYPIKIVTTYSRGYLTVQLLGTKTDDITVKMTYQQLSSTPWETVYEEDATLAPGTETVKTTPYTGYKVETYRNLYDGTGALLSSTLEATSDYKARNQVILQGPPVVSAPPTVPAEVPVSGPVQLPEEVTEPVPPSEPVLQTPEEPVEEPVQVPEETSPAPPEEETP